MPQTTGAKSWKDAQIELGTDGSTYTDFSGHSNSISHDGGERVTGTAYTNDGDTAIITRGKRQPMTITAQFVYTETGSEPYDTINDAYENGTDLYIRWSPGGGNSGDLQFESSAGTVKNPVYPGGEAESGEPILIELSLEVASVTESTIA